MDKMRTPAELKAAFLEALGSYPVILVDEYHDTDYFEGYDYRDYAYFNLDIEKLELIDDGSLRYVTHLLEDALRYVVRNPDRPKHAYTSASRKYSFGDTHDWWVPLHAESCDGRIMIHLEIGVHS